MRSPRRSTQPRPYASPEEIDGLCFAVACLASLVAVMFIALVILEH